MADAPAPFNATAWRQQVVDARLLADNDVPRAHAAALSLLAALPETAAGADRARALNLLSRTELHLALTDAAAQHANQAYELALQAGDRIGQAESDLNSALIAVNQGQIDRVVEVSSRSLAALEGTDRVDLLCESLLRTSMTYRRVGQIDESVTLAMQGLDMARRSGDPRALTFALHGAATSFNQSGRSEEAVGYFEQMATQARAVPNKLLEGDALAGLGGIKANQGDTAGGEALVRRAIALYEQAGAPYYAVFGRFALANVLKKQGRLSQALSLMDGILQVYQRYPNRIGQWYVLNARSEMLQQLGRLKPAKADAEQAHALAHDIGFPLYISDSARRLADIAAAEGNYRHAYELTTEANDMTARATRERSSARMVELAQRYRTQSQQREIEALKHHTEVQALELRERTLLQRWLWSLLAAGLLGLVGAGCFVVWLRRSRERLREHTDLLKSILDSMGDGVLVVDSQGRPVLINPLGRSLLGDLSPASSPDWAMHLGLRKPDRVTPYAPHELPLSRATRGESVDAEEIYQPHPSDPAMGRWFSVTTRPLRNAQGQSRGGVAVFADVSERRRAEEHIHGLNANLEIRVAERTLALEHSQLRAEAATQAKSEFLATMSHEIRTPMNAILGMSYLAMQSGLNEVQQGYVEKVHRAAETLLVILNDILDFSKIEAGHLTMEHIPFNPNDVLEQMGSVVGMRAEEKGLELLFDLPANLPRALLGDPTRLGQVLLNLGNNAVKFTERGTVVVKVRQQEGSETHSVLRFDITDSGIGIPLDRQASLFQPFTQADASTSRRYGGTGLGLTISQALVRLMGGDIGFESVPDRGSRFYFTARFEVQPGPHADATGCDSVHHFLGHTQALIVDDNDTARTVVAKMARGLGLVVDEAAGAAEALAALSRRDREGEPYDLLLLDWRMPGIDGMECLRRVAGLSLQRPAPTVLMLTAHGREEAQRHIEAFRLKVAAVLAKPIMPVALGRACARALGQVVSPGPALAPAPCSAAPALLRGARVLLVEDNEINRELALELLSRAGMIATAAVNGQEALDRLQDSDFDVVLMDCQMPLMDGFAATQALRRQPRLAQLPVIAMTADAMVGTRERAMAAGMNDYLTKPIRSAELFATLAHWLGARAVPLTPAPQPEPPANAAHQAELPAIAGLDVRAGLKSTLDDMALYRRALGLFARREAGFETQFRAAMAAQDHATLLRLVHDLKGTSATLGAERVNQHAKALEAILLGQPTNLVAAEPQRIATTEALRGLLADLAAAGIGA